MRIKNPENVELTVKVEGVTYTIEANGELTNIPEAHARYWQENLHKFLILRKDEEIKTPEKPKLSEPVLPPQEPETNIEQTDTEEVEEETLPEVEVKETKKAAAKPAK